MSDLINATQTNVATDRIATADLIIVDGSGSMYNKWASLMQAVDVFVGELTVETQITLIQFSGSDHHGPEFVTARDCTPSQWAPVSTGEFHPIGGMTPLYDAINMAGRHARDTNPIKPGVVLYVTDGEENTSKTTQAQAKAILDWMRAKGWTVKFLGCDFDNSKQAALLGGGKAEAIGVSTARLTDATKALAKKRNLHAQYGAPMEWSEDDHQQFGGYLGST